MCAGGVERKRPPRWSLTHTQQAAEVHDWGLGRSGNLPCRLDGKIISSMLAFVTEQENREHEGLWGRPTGVEEPEKNTQQLRFPLTLRFLALPPLAA